MSIIQTTNYFDEWHESMKDQKAKKCIRIARAEEGNFGDCAYISHGISEMRVKLWPWLSDILLPKRRGSLSVAYRWRQEKAAERY
jgi:hypothetical protein